MDGHGLKRAGESQATQSRGFKRSGKVYGPEIVAGQKVDH